MSEHLSPLSQAIVRPFSRHERVAAVDGQPGGSTCCFSAAPRTRFCQEAFPRLRDEWATAPRRLATPSRSSIPSPAPRPLSTESCVRGGDPHGPPDRVDGRADSACHIPRRQRQWIKAAQLTGTPPAGGPTLMMADEIFCSEAWAPLDPANARTGCRSVQTAWGTTRVGASKLRTPRRPPPRCGPRPG